MCDEVRIEINRKFMLIGVYTPNISVPQLPFVLPSLTFFQMLESDRPQQLGVRFRLQHLETGRIIAQGMGRIGFQRPGTGINALRLPNVPLIAVGTYNFVMEIDGEREPLIFSFDVILNIPQQPAILGGLPNIG
jgi:hypothetical protein